MRNVSKLRLAPLATLWLVAMLSCLVTKSAWAQDSTELAKKLANPIANLISVPIKLDWDTGIGPNDTDQYNYIVQPVIPFSLNSEWSVISRTIAPYVVAKAPQPGLGAETGLGDITQSFFFSPKAPTADGWIWGAGPALLLPTATNNKLGGEKWGLGPTFIVLKQDSGWTYGLLANQIWSVAGTDSRSDNSNTFLQPILSFTTKQATTYGVNTESTYNWKDTQWTVPINLTVSQLVRISGQPVSFTAGTRFYAERPAGGPDWGLRFTVTFLFPK